MPNMDLIDILLAAGLLGSLDRQPVRSHPDSILWRLQTPDISSQNSISIHADISERHLNASLTL
jgi:hypothetical protein